MPLNLFRKLCLVVSTLAVPGCATVARVQTVEVCLTDPRNNAMQCTPVKGDSYARPWERSDNFTCVPTLELKEYFKGCR